MESVGNPAVFDNPAGGIILELPISNGVSLTIYMGDDIAQGMVDILQNKLNARL